MKKNKSILSVIILFLLLACGDDDDNSSTISESKILGKWVIVKLDFEDNYLYPECAINNNTYEFKNYENLIYITYGGSSCEQSLTRNMKYTLEENNTLVRTIPNGGGPDSENDYVIKYNIKSLTEDELILEEYYVDEGFNDASIISQELRRDQIWERID